MSNSDIRIKSLQVGEALRRARENCGLKLRDLAQQLDGRYSYSYLGKLERGELAVSVETLLEIASAVQINGLRLILRSVGDSIGSNVNESQIFSLFNELVEAIEVDDK